MSIRYLESAEHVKATVQKSLNLNLSTSKALDISSCIIQGNRFFEAAIESPMVIKPLLTFYGMSALAKAVILGRNNRNLASLKSSHGVSDTTEKGSKLGQMTGRINPSGTLIEFNDVISQLDCFSYETKQNRFDILTPTANSKAIENTKIKIHDIWSRCPSLGNDYKQIFNANPNTIHVSIDVAYNSNDEKIVTVTPPKGTETIDDVKALTDSLRSKLGFLSQLCLVESDSNGSYTTLTFSNFLPDSDEFNRLLAKSEIGHFKYDPYPKNYSDLYPLIEINGVVPPISGGVSFSEQKYIEPIDGKIISEWTLMYIGAFLLSSYCRYRPNDWTHATQSRISPVSYTHLTLPTIDLV